MLSTPRKRPKARGGEAADLELPPEFASGAEVIKTHRKRQFFLFLSEFAKSILPEDAISAAFPRQLTMDAKLKAADFFTKIAKLREYPIFAVSYSAYMISSDERPYSLFETILRFLISFFLNVGQINDRVLDVLIPFMCTKLDDRLELCERLFSSVSSQFGPDVLFSHFLDFISKYESAIVIDFVSSQLPSFSLSQETVSMYVSVVEEKLTKQESLFPQSWKKLAAMFTSNSMVFRKRVFHTPVPSKNKVNLEIQDDPLSFGMDKEEKSKTPNPRSILKGPETTKEMMRNDKKITFQTKNHELDRQERHEEEEEEDIIVFHSPPPNMRGPPLNTPKILNSGKLIKSPPPKTPERVVSIDQGTTIPKPVFSAKKYTSYPKTAHKTSDDFLELLSELERKPSDELLLRIKNVVSVIKEIPKVELRVLFHESLVAFSRKEMQNNMFLLLSRLHTLVDPQYTLDIYLEISNENQTRYHYQMNDVEMNYQNFLRMQGQNLHEHPATLIHTAVDVHNELMMGFELLCKWDTSYSGVNKIYNVVRIDPSLNLSDYFDPITLPFKRFLITGLEQNSEREDFHGIDLTIQTLKERMEEGTRSGALTKKIEVLNEKMLDVISKNTSPGKRFHSPHFVKTPSRVLIEFEKDEEGGGEEDIYDENSPFIFGGDNSN